MSTTNEKNKEVVNVDEDDDNDDEEEEEDIIEEEQLEEYREMVQNLGTFPVSFYFCVHCVLNTGIVQS